MAGESTGTMTLVLALSAVNRLTNPAEAIQDAGRWSDHVGIVGDDYGQLTAAIERAGADPDFVSGEAEKAGSLASVRQRFATDRHVYVSADDAERPTVTALGWEFLSIAEAAESADWSLVDEVSG